MERKNVMVKNTVEALNDKWCFMEKGLVLNTSYDIFCLGEDISKYEDIAHCKNHYDDPNIYDDYEIEIHGYNIELWCENSRIESICCRESCIYKSHELLMMKIEDFLKINKEDPSDYDICYLPNSHQNQHVYDFDKSGLQVWVWRSTIRSIVISKYEDEQ